MGYPILIVVRDRNGAYRCRFPNGIAASSTHSAGVAVERLMDKIWKPGTHRAQPTRRRMGQGLAEFAIWPIEHKENWPMATHVPPRLLTENEKREVIKCSMVNLGRLLAQGMELHFYREPGAAADAPVRLDVRWPDGTATTAQFVGCSPVHRVPMVAAVDAVLDELEV